VSSWTEVSLFVYCVNAGTRFDTFKWEDWIPLLEGATTSTWPSTSVGVVNRHGQGWRRGRPTEGIMRDCLYCMIVYGMFVTVLQYAQ
jgi:hypothetical protein